MNRQEFMKQLEMLLSDISQAEREEALQYYNDYLDDAGIENEEESIGSLGSPAQVAANIKEGLRDGIETGEFTEGGYHMNMEEEAPAAPESAEESEASGNNSDRIVLQLGDDFSEDTFAKAFDEEKTAENNASDTMETENREQEASGGRADAFQDQGQDTFREQVQETADRQQNSRYQENQYQNTQYQGNPGQSSQYQGNPGQGTQYKGNSNQGNQYQGNPGQGSQYQGNPGQGTQYQGNPNQGAGYQGNPGGQYQGNPNQGYQQGQPYQGALILIIIRGLTAINIRIPITSIRARDPISISTRTNMVIPTIPITDLLKRDVRPVKSYCLFFYVFLPCRLSSR